MRPNRAPRRPGRPKPTGVPPLRATSWWKPARAGRHGGELNVAGCNSAEPRSTPLKPASERCPIFTRYSPLNRAPARGAKASTATQAQMAPLVRWLRETVGLSEVAVQELIPKLIDKRVCEVKHLQILRASSARGLGALFVDRPAEMQAVSAALDKLYPPASPLALLAGSSGGDVGGLGGQPSLPQGVGVQATPLVGVRATPLEEAAKPATPINCPFHATTFRIVDPPTAAPAAPHPCASSDPHLSEAPRTTQWRRRSEAPPGTGGGGCYATSQQLPQGGEVQPAEQGHEVDATAAAPKEWTPAEDDFICDCVVQVGRPRDPLHRLHRLHPCQPSLCRLPCHPCRPLTPLPHP